MSGLTFDKLLLIGLLAVLLLGPERLPYYASQLARGVRSVRNFANGAKERLREEMGPDFDDVDWKKLDPRQYDPRRIIREALLDEEDEQPPRPVVRPAASSGAAGSTVRESAYAQRQRKIAEGTAAPRARVKPAVVTGSSVAPGPGGPAASAAETAEKKAGPAPFDSEAT